ncbi:MAG: hypothetical protein Q8936_15410 [Bacillota bacterium]|nr:hypothetical protein [Bacillota bacterium]
MNREFENYTNKVLMRIGVNGKKAKQIREDIYNSLMEKQQSTGESDPYILMGDPKEVAEEFRENLGIENVGHMNSYDYFHGYEYVSERKVFGVPLVHVVAGRIGVAKGVIAVGPVSIGVISIGAISVGLLSIGALALGLLFGFGGFAISGLMSAGGFALSAVVSFGGFAAAKCFAMGGFAAADIAMGGITKGVVSVFRQSGTGTYVFQSPVKIDEVMNAIKHVYPDMGKFALSIIEFFCRGFQG